MSSRVKAWIKEARARPGLPEPIYSLFYSLSPEENNVPELLELGCRKINQMSMGDNRTPFTEAVCTNQPRIMQWLLQGVMIIGIPTDSLLEHLCGYETLYSPLELALRNSTLESARMLTALGCKVHSQDFKLISAEQTVAEAEILEIRGRVYFEPSLTQILLWVLDANSMAHFWAPQRQFSNRK